MSGLEGYLRGLLREIVREEVEPIAIALGRLEQAVKHCKMPEPSQYLSAAEAAELAGVTAETIKNWCRKGELRDHRAGRLVRIRRDELEDYLARQNAQPSGNADVRVSEILDTLRK